MLSDKSVLKWDLCKRANGPFDILVSELKQVVGLLLQIGERTFRISQLTLLQATSNQSNCNVKNDH